MTKKILHSISVIIRKTGTLLHKISLKIYDNKPCSVIVKTGSDRNLYQTEYGDLYWLNSTGYIDKCIIQNGIFEEMSTKVVKQLIKPGHTVLDVGANIGYYSVLFSKLVGEQGRVICFEPTIHYGKVLEMNIKANSINNVQIHNIGLSNKEQELEIHIGQSSATIHFPANIKEKSSELIKLSTLDSFLEKYPLSKLDFIKIDVDGHEPMFFEGAWNSLEKYKPVILLEVNHHNYFIAGYNAWDFYNLIKGKGYYIYSEDGLIEIANLDDFLIKCGNFAYSANIIISKKRLNLDTTSF